jgi:hypothetical protein
MPSYQRGASGRLIERVQLKTENPFTLLHETAERLQADHVREDMRTLALIVRCAHVPSDVWAGCRVARAIAGYKDDGVAAYLMGPHFQPFQLSTDGSEIDVEALKEHAETYLSTKL